MLVHSVGWLMSGLALAGVGYTLFVSVLVISFKGTEAAARDHEAVTILKPLHFDEPGLFRSLASFIAQDYGAPVQILFGVQDAGDPAIAIVRKLKDAHPEADIGLVVDTELHGSNRKVSNLINMAPFAKHDILVISDSDISVAGDWLRRIVGTLSEDGVGAVSCLYAGRAQANVWSMLAAMGSSYEFLPNVVAGLSSGLAAPCFGSTIAFRRETLDEIGGFRAFANRLADDYEIGREIRARGLKVAIPAFTVDHASGESGLAELFHHEIRWNRTTHVIDPIGHTGSAVTHCLPLALIAALLTGFAAFSVYVIAAALLARLVLKWAVERKFDTYAGPALVLPLRDAMSFCVFLASFFAEEVRWRGDRFAVTPSGALSHMRSS